ncbi:hypothetical protein [Kordia sp.]|uniref:hypothetical protein n=1 Tax=Kordia sp. TaxID=1965332 RepID=UPI003B59EF27
MKKKYTIPILGFFIISLLACIKKPEENTRESTEKSKKVISKTDFDDNENGFYYLGHLGTNEQPKNSLICWAVCIANVAQGILDKQELTPCDIITSIDGHCEVINEIVNINKTVNSRRSNKQIENAAKNIGLTLTDFKKEKFSDFESMKKLFKEEAVPIIVKLKHDKQSHLIYISGYGTFNGCNYYYIFDPLPGEEKFRPVEDFKSDLEINFEKAWKPQLIKDKKEVLPLKKSIVNQRIIYIEKKLDSIYNKREKDSIIDDINFKDPLLYISTNKVSLKVFEQETFDENKVFAYFESSCGDIPESRVGPSEINIERTIYIQDRKIIAKRLLVGNHEYTTNNGKLEISIKSDNNDDFLYRLKLDNTVLQEFTKYDQKKLSEKLKSIKQ